jgi:hydrophobic/amphiphilic exporter-1 (mainly G- bacteria), HAE1 family
MVFNTAAQTYGYGNVRPSPANFNLSQPEWQAVLNERGRELGLTTRDVGTAVRGLFDGAFVDDFRLGAETVDLVVVPIGGELPYKEKLASTPIATPAGPIVPLDSVIDVREAAAPQEISRIEELPAVTVQVTPKEGQSVEELVADIRDNVVEAARQAGLIDGTMRIRYEGTAAKLDEVTTAMFGRGDSGDPDSGWRRASLWLSYALGAAGLIVGGYVLQLGVRRGKRAAKGRMGGYGVGAVGALMLAVVIGGLFFGIAHEPQLATARFVWALLVTYLLMCALFESFLYPLVIMFSVPLAVVGGFVALRLLHERTLQIPWQAPQQLDVVTMLGFIILIGTVVNNAILLVERALQRTRPSGFGDDEQPMDPLSAIAASAQERARPIFMTTMTTIGGMSPLVFAPGAGSEMYRGLGAVVLGGLLVASIFTLVLIPLVFGLVVQMRDGLMMALSRPTGVEGGAGALPGTAAPSVALTAPATGSNGHVPAPVPGGEAAEPEPR